MEKLVKILKSRCTGLFAKAGAAPSWGLDQSFDKGLHLELCKPSMVPGLLSRAYAHLYPSEKYLLSCLYPLADRHSPILLPEAFKALLHRPEKFHNLDELCIFHYPLHIGKVKKKINESAVNPKEYFVQFAVKYGDVSCIRMNLDGYVVMLGNSRTMQDVMDYLKKGPENAFRLMKELIPKENQGGFRADRNRMKSVRLHDLLKEPKEVRYQR